MKQSFSKILTITAAVSMLAVGALSAAPEEHQGHMAAAKRLLNEAKSGKDAGASLEAAKHELEVALHNKAGLRLKAIGFVDAAISDVKAGDHPKMEADIDKAIADIDEGMAVAR